MQITLPGRKQAKLRNDGPACRVCNCTYSNACDGGCWWVPVPRGEPMLCSACVGTAGDILDTGRRIVRLTKTTHAKLERVRERAKEEE